MTWLRAAAMATSPNSPDVLRPKRFPLQLPVEFRSGESDRWWRAQTENISANGVLLHSRRRVPPLTPVQVKLQLPSVLTGEGTVRLLCSGYVVRSVAPRFPFGKGQIAATFVDYQLANGKPGPIAELRQAQMLAARGEVARLVHRLNDLLSIIVGNAELVLFEPGDQAAVRNYALQTRQTAEEAAIVVRSLAQTLK